MTAGMGLGHTLGLIEENTSVSGEIMSGTEKEQ